MKIQHAADLIQKGYDRQLSGDLAVPALHHDGIEAYLLKDGTLVVPGTNDLKDWWRNINLGSVKAGASRRVWHKGFLDHARVIYHYAVDKSPKRVIGHSLGAAAAQILAVSFKIPAICFASPRPLRGSRHFSGERAILNINRRDDLVTQVPPAFRFRHVGHVHWISPRESVPQRNSHSLPDYQRALAQGVTRPALPKDWA